MRRAAFIFVMAAFLFMPLAHAQEGGSLLDLPAITGDEPMPHIGHKTFHGYKCTKDCAGHKAGYAWAQKKHISTPAGCKSNNRSFNEGCLAWTLEKTSKKLEH